MNLKQHINKSAYGTVGYVASEDDLFRMEQYILYNLEVLKNFKHIIVSTNYGGGFQNKNFDLWKKYFPESILIDNPINRGHSFGTADLDNALFNYCKNNNIEWLCKCSNDTLLNSKIFQIQIEEADFYYMNGFSFETIYLNDMDFKKLKSNHFTPQTNFYIINVLKSDYLNDSKYLDNTYNIVNQISDYNGKPWDYIEGWSCEEFLAQCVKRNNLKTYHILDSGNLYLRLFNTIKNNKIGDPSHKNIMIQGICHFHFPNENIFEIDLEN